MNTRFLLLLPVAALSLSACSSAKEQLGLNKKVPDEFSVLKRAPLSMPPDYTLRPPRPGAPRPQESETAQEAKKIVFGRNDSSEHTSENQDAEKAFLQAAGTENIDPEVRAKLDEEAAYYGELNKPVAKKLLGLGGDPNEASAVIIDAPAEAKRLKENAEKDLPLTEGEVPTIED